MLWNPQSSQFPQTEKWTDDVKIAENEQQKREEQREKEREAWLTGS